MIYRASRPMNYRLVNGKAEPCSMLEWGIAFEDHASRVVEQTDMIHTDGRTGQVSTVFIGMDFNFHGDGPPILWESLTFGCPEIQQRYDSAESARKGHLEIVNDLMKFGWSACATTNEPPRILIRVPGHAAPPDGLTRKIDLE